MNPIAFAMRRPVTTLMLVVALVGGGTVGLNEMRADTGPPQGISPARTAPGVSRRGIPATRPTRSRKSSMSGTRALPSRCRCASPAWMPVGVCATQPM